MVDFFFRYFLLFPKVPLTPEWGILLGEIFLFFYVPIYVLGKKGKIVIAPVLVFYYMFVVWHIFVSSMVSAIIVGFIPAHSGMYIIRMVLYIGIFFIAFEQYSRYSDNAEIVKRVFNRPFIVQFYFGSLVVAVYYATHQPTAAEIIWVYEVGLRLIPNSSLHIDFNSFFFLKAVQGAGNLLAGWALAILIVNKNHPALAKNPGIGWICILTVLLTLSRGGFLTVMLYLAYDRLIRGRFRARFMVSLKTVAVASVVLVLVVTYFIYAREIPLPNIFERLDITYSGKGFDSSSLARFRNYTKHFDTWVSEWYHFLIGYGFDKKGMEILTGLIVVESFFFSVLISSGIIGLFLLTLLYLKFYVDRVKNFWFKCLWEFIFFESIIMWTITGGDFFAPQAAYLMLAFIGFGFAEQVKRSKADSLENL